LPSVLSAEDVHLPNAIGAVDSDAYTGEWACTAGYQAMQFTAAVETNVCAVKLYRSLGFEVPGTLPKGFRHRLVATARSGRHQRGYLLLEWIRQAEQDAPEPMKGFAGFLRRDPGAVKRLREQCVAEPRSNSGGPASSPDHDDRRVSPEEDGRSSGMPPTVMLFASDQSQPHPTSTGPTPHRQGEPRW
jgi:hypothetical protein